MKIRKKQDSMIVEGEFFRYEFRKETAGFPARIGFSGADQPVLSVTVPLLTAVVDGRKVAPHLARFRPEVRREQGSIRISFDNVGWADDRGRTVDGYRLALSYTLHPDGAAFVKAFFFTETLAPGRLRDFVLRVPFRPHRDDRVNWAFWEFPKSNSAELIQALGGFERNLRPGRARIFPGTVLPFVGFDFGRGDRRDRHVEYFVESFNSLTSDYRNTETAVAWRGNRAEVSWNFQKQPRPVPGRSYQWGNLWGWTLREFPVERRHTPFRIYHHFDNFEKYPAAKTIAQAAGQGCNLFIFHENWRFDVKDGEFAQDDARLKSCIRAIHRHGMRTALYVRGNEDSLKEEDGASVLAYLKKNYDGLYMDFGSPVCYKTFDEFSPGGKIPFREYYNRAKRWRAAIGEQGVFLSHSGSFFAASAHTFMDGYVAGEQEKGQLIRDRAAHAYYSGVSVCPSTLWTAAFPTYRTKAALPYLATAAQSPFVNLGVQGLTSSLAHPSAPSVITFQRPLWRLWELLDGRPGIRVYSTYSSDLLTTDSPETGACLMVDRGGNGLLIAANFADKTRPVCVRADWVGAGMRTPGKMVELYADEKAASYREMSLGKNLSRELEGFGLAAWLLPVGLPAWRKRLNHFARPYPSHPADEARYRREVEQLRRSRFEPPAWDKCFMRVYVPNWTNNYEDSLWWDLFDNVGELRQVEAGGKERLLGYLSRKGLGRAFPDKKDYLWPGVYTSWVPLHKAARIGKDGVAHLVVATTRQRKFEFYNFFAVQLSPTPAVTGRTYEITFNNALDLDWSRLDFKLRTR